MTTVHATHESIAVNEARRINPALATVLVKAVWISDNTWRVVPSPAKREGQISSIKRLTNSTSGNPRYCITFQTRDECYGVADAWVTQSFNTAADHAFAFSIGNTELRVGDFVNFEVRRGVIVDMTPSASEVAK